MGAEPAEEEQFGPYLVYERLGVGGMATVHRAIEHGGTEGFERTVALKRLLPHLAEDASFIKSFVREAKLASMLNHVNIVQIYELGRVGTQYFISMEYIDGRDVRRVLRHARKVTGPPPIHVTVGLIAQLCEALDYAHSRVDETGHPLGLVHRDVSPSNVLVTSTGHVKVIDFGIAKAQSSQLRTQTGRVKGKLAYMAPEAIAGKDLDARSDLWAVGVILHELLTARPLFASKNEYQTLLKVQRGEIMPPSTFNQACPPELDAIVFKALARDPDDRFMTAGELREELLKLRHQYQLSTGYRDVAAWLDWAFSLETPSGFGGNTGDNNNNTGTNAFQESVVRGKTPRPRNREEDEAVEMVWGAGEGEQHSGPVLLDDIPDVSGKHRRVQRPEVAAANPGAAAAAEEIDDDIPTPLPTHGSRSRELPAVRGTNPDVAASIARGSDRLAAQRAGTQPRPRAVTQPPAQPPARPKKPTVPMPAGSPVARKRAESAAPTDPEGRPLAADEHAAASSTEMAADTLVGMKAAPPAETSPRRMTSEGDGITNPLAVPLEAPPAPVVRFTKTPSTPPPNVPMRASAQTIAQVEPLRAPPPPPEPPPPPIPSTKPGLGVEAGAPIPSVRVKRPSNVTIGQAVVERNKPNRAWLLLLLLVIAGGAATGITLMVTSGKDTVTPKLEKPPVLPKPVQLTVKFITEPTDAEIRIEGRDPHVGSPWSIELEPGVYQIDIRRDGYNSWLTTLELSASDGNQTLRVGLVPRGNGVVAAEAMVAVSTTPAGLDVYLDGEILPQKTPATATVKVGAHVVAVRQNGVEVWKQAFTAEASANYEYNPVLTAEKQKERIERATHPSVRPTPPRETQKPVPDDDEKGSAPTPVDQPVEQPTPTPAITTQVPSPTPPVTPTPTPPPPVTPTPPPVTPPPAITTQVPHPPAQQAPHPPAGPVIIVATSVTKLSGETPKLSAETAGLGGAKRDALPPVVSAKVCIDTAGTVTSVDPIGSKLDRTARSELIAGLRTWRYSPYKKDGAALAACFVVSLRTR